MRTLRRLHTAVRDDLGDLVTRRPLPARGLEQIDPFLFLNHHGPQVYPPRNQGLPFGPHPHRGFETVTFILEGSLMHRDTGGHESVIHAGGVQWMTAGRGLEHAELSPEEFLRDGGPLEILQLWVNLPPELKMTDPRYTGLQRDAIPEVELAPGVRAAVLSGTIAGTTGPFASITGVAMNVLRFDAGSRAELPAPRDRNVFLYVVRGAMKIAGTEAAAFQLAEMNEDGEAVVAEAMLPSVVLFGHASAIGAPVVSYGPFVMNTREEIVQAIRDYEAGHFR
jgi:redox-sensitive bicupin YhaK (pirin superfamily)